MITNEEKVDAILAAVKVEVMKAVTKHAPMATPHHGYAVILEELDELWDHVKADTAQLGPAKREAVQIAAMGVRYVLDICS